MKIHWKLLSALGAVWMCISLAGCTFPGYVPPAGAGSAVPELDKATATHVPGNAEAAGGEELEAPQEDSGFCDRAAPGHPIDVTIADGTVFQPEEAFTKTWRLVNAGDCAWSEDYAIVYFSGEPMGSARIFYLDVPVQPGESVDLSIEMAAPQQNGWYQSNWKMRNAEGVLFGLGPHGDAPFWARIGVNDGSVSTEDVSPTSTPVPMIYQQGTLDVVEVVHVDVDSGAMSMSEDADVSLTFEDKQLIVAPLGEAKLGLPGEDVGMPPAQLECIQTPLAIDDVVIELLDEDVYICYQSSQGLPGYIWLKSMEDQTAQPEAAFVTWFVP